MSEGAVDNPVADGGGDDVEAAQEPIDGAQVPEIETRADDQESPVERAATNVFAKLAEAPTNWHQATIYFMTSTAKEDEPMRKLAPLMFCGGLAMVLLQIAAIYGLVSGLVHPSCTSNTQCTRPGFFCYIEPDEDRGKVHPDAPGPREISHPDAVLCVQCQMCGEMPPLVPYRSPTEKLTEEEVKDDRTNNWKDSPLGLYKEYNLVWDLHYPQQAGGGRAKTPDWFAGWNYSMVESTCAYGEHVHEIAPFHWEFTTDSSGAYTITDRGDIPEWVDLTRIFPTIDLVYTHFDENCVARWCDACVEHEALDHGDGLSMADAQTRLTVSIMNKKLLAETSVKAMVK